MTDKKISKQDKANLVDAAVLLDALEKKFSTIVSTCSHMWLGYDANNWSVKLERMKIQIERYINDA